MAQVLDSPTHSPIQSRKVIHINADSWRRRGDANRSATSSNSNGNRSSDPFVFEDNNNNEGEHSNSSLFLDTSSSKQQYHTGTGTNSNSNLQWMDPSQQSQSQASQSQSQSHSQAMSEILTQNADYTQMTQDADLQDFSLSPLAPPHSPLKPEKVPWGRLMPCSGGKAIELLPKAPTEKALIGTGGFSLLLGMKDLHPSDQFNEVCLGRSLKCDVIAPKPQSKNSNNNSKKKNLDDWAYGLISNKHCRIYCTLSEGARSRSINSNSNIASNMEVWVEDSSNNGTMVNQTILLKRGQKRQLHSGDEVSLLNASTLRKRIPDDASWQPLLQHHSFVFVNVVHQQQQTTKATAQAPGRPSAIMPPFSNPTSSARKRRGLVNPRAMNYPGSHHRGARSNNQQQQQQQQQKTPPVPSFASAAANSASFASIARSSRGHRPTPKSGSSRGHREQRGASGPEQTTAPTECPSSPRRIETEYDIRDLLGRGTCGEVRRAIHRTSGLERAVKIVSLPPPGLKSHKQQQDAKQWEAEARILQTLEHPYIVQLVDVFCTDTHLYLVMELSNGGDLFDRIVQRGKYTEDSSRRVMRRLLSAVHYIHEDCEIVHRDLKPENILLSSSDIDVKITDFGVAKSASGGLKTLCGTPGYLAPEVLKRRHTVLGQGRYGKSVDVWSLGVILYVLLSGRQPFDVDGVQGMEVILQSGNKIDFPPEDWSSISQEATDLVKQCLVSDPRKRISVREACEHPWILMDDGDTHRHPLEDPKLLLVTKKRLFEAGSPVPTPVSTVCHLRDEEPATKRMKINSDDSTAQTVAEAAARSQEQPLVDVEEDSFNDSVSDAANTSRLAENHNQLENGTQPPTVLDGDQPTPPPTNVRSKDKEGTGLESSITSRDAEKPPEDPSHPERVSSKLAESLISRVMLSAATNDKTTSQPLNDSSNTVQTPLEKKKETKHKVKQVDKDETASNEATEDMTDPAVDTPSHVLATLGTTSPKNPDSSQHEQGRRVTPAGVNPSAFTKSAIKATQATQHFQPKAAATAPPKAKGKSRTSQKAKKEGLVVAAELEEDKICSQFSDEDTESIASFGDAMTVEKETDGDADDANLSSKSFKPKKGKQKDSCKKTKDGAASKTKVKKPPEKKSSTTIVKKTANSAAAKTRSKKSATSTKDVPDVANKTRKQKQTTLAKWFQPNKTSDI